MRPVDRLTCEEVFRRLVRAFEDLRDAEDAIERAAAEGKVEGYSLRLGVRACARGHTVRR